MDGVLGTVVKGNQVQIVIGPEVSEVYKEFIAQTGLHENDAIEENMIWS